MTMEVPTRATGRADWLAGLAQHQRLRRNNDEALVRCLQCKVAQHTRRLQFMEHRERRSLDRDNVLADPGSGGDADPTKSLIQPPVVVFGFHLLVVAGDGVEVRALDNDRQVFGHRLFDTEFVARAEATARREGLPDEFVLELHGAIPRIALHACLLYTSD